jgi:hypothetical protein
VTAAVALAWIVVIRSLPRAWETRLAMPASVSRFGVRHILFVLVAWLVVAWVVWSITAPPAIDRFDLVTIP